MRKILLLAAAACTLTGCGAAHNAKLGYIRATAALNACLLANPSNPAACNAQVQVQQNELMLYSNLSD